MKKYAGLAVTLCSAWGLGNSGVSNYYKASIVSAAYAYAFYTKLYREDDPKDRGFESFAFAASTSSTPIFRHVLNNEFAPRYIKAVFLVSLLINHAMIAHRFYESVRAQDESFVYI
ncbi:MAG: hypothetical protein ACK5WS_06310 [Alphaproteobacteria bacterium]|jgi:hypothetical protein|nr:hypothetical protein [Candidatus Jidaibacter sp.]